MRVPLTNQCPNPVWCINYMLSQQHKINALRCFFAISERLVLPKINAPGARKSRKSRKSMHQIWFGTSILVCRCPGCIVFGLLIPPNVSIFGSQKYKEMPGASILVFGCIGIIGVLVHLNMGCCLCWVKAEHEDEGLLARDVYVEGGLDLVNHEPEKHDDDDGDHGDGDGDAARCPSFSPILVDSFKRQYGSRRQQLWLWYALVGRGPIQWAYHGPKYIKIEFRCLDFNFYACNVSTQLSVH